MTTNTVEAQGSSPKKSILEYISGNIRDYGLLISLIVIVGFFQYMTEGRMLAPSNINNIPNQNGYVIVMALGMLLVIVAGHIDLSVGSVCAFTGAVAATLMVKLGWHWAPAAVATLVVGALIGGIQGYFIAYLRIPSFIVTLAGMLVFRGLTYRLLGNTNVGPLPAEFNQLSAGWIPDPFASPGFFTTTFALGLIAAPDLKAAAAARVKFKAPGVGVGVRVGAGVAPPDLPPPPDVKAGVKAKIGVKVPAVKIQAPAVKAGAAIKAKAGAGVKAGAGIKVQAPSIKIKAPEVKLKAQVKGGFKIGN